MKIMKFGGTSLGSAQNMFRVMQIVAQESTKKMIVLSALSGVTNLLEAFVNKEINLEKTIDELMRRHLDQIKDLGLLVDSGLIKCLQNVLDQVQKLGENIECNKEEILVQGELISVRIFQALLTRNQIESIILDQKFYIKLNSENEPILDVNDELIGSLDDGVICLVPGFIAVKNDKITNLGRGGSDFSATIFGATTLADSIEIWTDVDGVHQNDPRFVKDTKVISHLSYIEASELAYFGAKILHPLCVEPAKNSNIPILLKSTLNPKSSGTFISKRSNGANIVAIAGKEGIASIRITSASMLNSHGYLSQVFEVFNQFSISIDMITTAEVSVAMTIEESNLSMSLIEQLELYGKVEVHTDLSIVCVVGNFKSNQIGFAGQILQQIKEIPLHMISYGGNEHNISVVLNTSKKNHALIQLQELVVNNLVSQ